MFRFKQLHQNADGWSVADWDWWLHQVNVSQGVFFPLWTLHDSSHLGHYSRCSLMTGCTSVWSSQIVLVGYLWKSGAGNLWEEPWWAGRWTAQSEHMELQWARSQSCHSCFSYWNKNCWFSIFWCLFPNMQEATCHPNSCKLFWWRSGAR